MTNPLTARSERWVEEARRLRRIHQEPGALHSLGCVRDDDGELRCTCTPLVLRGDDDED